MEKEKSHMTERILNLTLEIIHLLTGEGYTLVKKTHGDRSGKELPPFSAISKKKNIDKKILKLTQEIIEILTEEEWMRLEDEDDALTDNQPPLTSPDESSNRNLPERCARPLCSQDSTQEDDDIISYKDQGEDPINIKVEVMDDEEIYLKGDEVDLHMEIGIDGRSRGTNAEQNLVLSTCKLEDDDSSESSSDEREVTIEPNIHPVPSVDKSVSPEKSSPYKASKVTTQTRLVFRKEAMPDDLSPLDSSNFHLGHYRLQKSQDPSNTGENLSDLLTIIPHRMVPRCEKFYPCLDCGKNFTQHSKLIVHRRIHTGEKPFPCQDCGKGFTHKSYLVQHQRIHSGEKPYQCSDCGKCFTRKADLVKHYRIHTGEKPFRCTDCGKCFTQKSASIRHQRFHSGEKPFPCDDCGKSFKLKPALLKHQKLHVPEKSPETPE